MTPDSASLSDPVRPRRMALEMATWFWNRFFATAVHSFVAFSKASSLALRSAAEVDIAVECTTSTATVVLLLHLPLLREEPSLLDPLIERENKLSQPPRSFGIVES